MALLDILSLAEGRTAVGVAQADTSRDVTLAGYITAASKLIDDEFGPVVVRQVIDVRDGGTGEVYTSRCPVKSFTTVTEYVATVAQVLTLETYSTTATYGYWAEPYSQDPTLYSGFLHRRTTGSPSVFGSGFVRIDYQAGRFTDTAAVDGRWKLAANIVLKNLWRAEELSANTIDPGFDVPAQNFPGFALPNAVVELLASERQRVPGIA